MIHDTHINFLTISFCYEKNFRPSQGRICHVSLQVVEENYLGFHHGLKNAGNDRSLQLQRSTQSLSCLAQQLSLLSDIQTLHFTEHSARTQS